MIINELGGSPIRSDNVYFANNEQASLAFFIAHVEHNLIKLRLYNNWSAQAINIISECALCVIQANQSNSSPLNISQSIDVEESTCDRNKSKKFLGCSMLRETSQLKQKTEDGESLFFKALVNRVWLTLQNLLMVQQSCSWPTFHQMDFMKRLTCYLK